MQSALINEGRDLHLHHGPIDLIISAIGSNTAVQRVRTLAENRFATVLNGLVEELTQLRMPVARDCDFSDPIARRMWRATSLFANPLSADECYLTPMASVAGSVADEILSAVVVDKSELLKVWINNGGDIALWQAIDQSSTVGVADPLSGEVLAHATIKADSGISGIATSGQHGRSLSLGIADSVTVLAGNAAIADTAATLIANAVDLPQSGKVTRAPASDVDPDSDLGNQLVTIGVDHLSESECHDALQRGLQLAELFMQQRRIKAAYLVLQGQYVATEYFCCLQYPENHIKSEERVNA